jgi:hypothetical protein
MINTMMTMMLMVMIKCSSLPSVREEHLMGCSHLSVHLSELHCLDSLLHNNGKTWFTSHRITLQQKRSTVIVGQLLRNSGLLLRQYKNCLIHNNDIG